MHAHTDHSRHSHAHVHGAGGRTLFLALIFTIGFAAVEAVAGWWSGSLALLGDAGHMVSDAFALGFAAVAARISQRPPTQRHSYGMGRAEVIAAMVNGVFMLAVVIGIVLEAIERFTAPTPVAGGVVMLVAAVGLAVNVIVMWTLARGEKSLNVRGAMLHVMGDLLGSLAALASGAVIWFSGWTLIDPILSVFICVLILISSLRLLREALHVLMEGVPPHLDLNEVGEAMAAADPRVQSVHDLHIWSLSSGRAALSAHVVLDDMANWEAVLSAMHRLLHERFGIDHVTLQPETPIKVLRPMFRRSPGPNGAS